MDQNKHRARVLSVVLGEMGSLSVTHSTRLQNISGGARDPSLRTKDSSFLKKLTASASDEVKKRIHLLRKHEDRLLRWERLLGGEGSSPKRRRSRSRSR